MKNDWKRVLVFDIMQRKLSAALAPDGALAGLRSGSAAADGMEPSRRMPGKTPGGRA